MVGDADADIIEGIYAATLGEKSWQDWLDELVRRYPGAKFAVWGHDIQANSNLGIVQSGFDPWFLEQWTTYYAGINAWAPGLARSPLGVPQTAEQILDRSRLVRTEYYNDWVRPQENIATGVSISLFDDPNRYFGLTANVRLRDEEKHNAPIVHTLRAIAPHMARAFELSRHVQPMAAQTSFENFINSIPLATIALNSRGQYCFMNTRALRFLEQCPDIGLRSDGALIFADDAAQRQLDLALGRILLRDMPSTPDRFALRLSDGSGAFSVSVVPYPVDPPPAGHRFALDATLRPAAILFLEEGQAQTRGRVLGLLRSRFGLSPAEAQLAWSLYRGLTLKAVGEGRGISMHTVRNQLRSVFAKTHTNKQHQLVRLMADLSRADGEPEA